MSTIAHLIAFKYSTKLIHFCNSTKKIYLTIALSLIFLIPFKAFCFQKVEIPVNDDVKKLIKIAYDARLEDAQKTEMIAEKAIQMAKSTENNSLLAEAYRVKGIGQSYQGKYANAYDSYLEALKSFEIANDKTGQAKVNMNIGNLYREDDYDKALLFYKKSMPVAIALKDSSIIAALSLNMGNVYFRQEKYNEALDYFKQALRISKHYYGQDHPSIGIYLTNVGDIHRKVVMNTQV